MTQMQTKKKVKRMFSPREAAQIAEDKRHLEERLASPYITDKDQIRRTLGRMNDMERLHAVPDLNPQQRDMASKRVSELESQIKEGMLSSEEMRRAPPGAVDQNVAWERRNKNKIIQWRNLNAALHKGLPADQSQELGSIERLRPRVSHLSMEGAQIPAVRTFSFPSPAYSANWDEIFGPKSEPETPSPIELHEAEPEPLTAQSLLDEDDDVDIDPAEALLTLGGR